MKQIKLKIGMIIEREDKILLMKEKYLSGSGHKWNCGTGSWEESDGDIVNSPIREAREELGLDIELQGVVKVALIEKEDKIKIQFFFAARPLNNRIILPPKEEQQKLNESIIDFRWYDKKEILEMADDEFVTTTVAKVLKEYLQNPQILPLDSLEFFDKEKTN